MVTWLWVLCWFLVLSPVQAWAFDIDVAARDGALRRGDVGWVWLAVQDDGGQPVTQSPRVRSADAAVRVLTAAKHPGVWLLSVAPHADATEVDFIVEYEGKERSARLPVSVPKRPRLVVPDRVVGSVDEQEVRFIVRGKNLPYPDDLEVHAEDARLVGVRDTVEGLEVTLAPNPSTDERPRAMLVAVRDARYDAPPAWVVVWLKGWVQLTVDLEEVGAKAWLTVGTRTYGPVVAGEDTRVVLRGEMNPGESEAKLRILAPDGNEFVLPRKVAEYPRLMMADVVGTRVPMSPPPDVYLRVVRASGQPWRRDPPVCRTPRHGELSIVQMSTGTWRVQVPYVAPDEAWELRVRCELADGTSTHIVVPTASDVVTDMTFRVWPEELSADFPVADVQVALHNAVGERVPIVSGEDDVRLAAELGKIDQIGNDGPVLRGEYSGGLAAEVGEDRLEARWYAPPGEGPVAHLEVLFGDIPRAGVIGVWVRALDARWRPLEGREVEVSLGSSSIVVASGGDGWTRAVLPVAPGSDVLRVQVSCEQRLAEALAIRGTRGPDRKSGAPDLARRVQLPVETGRIAEVELDIQPRLLRPEKRQTATVRARFVDRSGRTAISARPVVTTTEGELREVEPDSDGTMRWTLVPKASFRARTITITARSEVLDVEEDLDVTVRAKPVDVAIGLMGGLHSNLGSLLSPYGALTGDFRVRVGRDPTAPLGPSRFFVRASVSFYTAGATVTVAGTEARIRTTFFPLSLTLMLRQEYSDQAFWFGLGGELAPYWGVTSFNEEVQFRGSGVLAPGLCGNIGYGVRIPTGELAVELRGSSLTSPGSETSVGGFVGGVAITLGYRVVF